MSASPVLSFPAGIPENAASLIAREYSLLGLDYEIESALECIQDELEETGTVSDDAQIRFEALCAAFGEKVDRMASFIRFTEARSAHCKDEAARIAQYGKSLESKVARTKSLLRYFMESRDLKKLQGEHSSISLRANSQERLEVANEEQLPAELKIYEMSLSSGLLRDVFAALPPELREAFEASIKKVVVDNAKIREELKAGAQIEGAVLRNDKHIRIS